MNKEEIKDKIRELKTHRQEVWTDIEILQHDRMLFALEKMLLKQENKQLRKIIDKAIEYLDTLTLQRVVYDTLREILKGDSNER